MPFKDPKKRKEMQLQYTKAYGEREKVSKPVGLCSVTGCTKPTSSTNKKCDHHLAYMREYKKKYRVQAKAPGICNNSDCINPAREGFKLCEKCNEQSKTKQRIAVSTGYRVKRDQTIQEEVLAAYGSKCLCCKETIIEFLSIDHIDGYDGTGPRKGSQLYRWLKANNYPPGYRCLCMTCNFTLGHHGYCPHSDLTAVTRVGRPEVRGILSAEDKRKKRQYWISYKKLVFDAYGGCRCACCGVTEHEFLQIDHVDNNGAAHRKELTGSSQDGRNLYVWLRRNGFPPGYAVLCCNCNYAKGHFGHCPHQAS